MGTTGGSLGRSHLSRYFTFDKVAFKRADARFSGTIEQEHTLSDAHLDMALKLVHALVMHHNYLQLSHVAKELAARNLRIWLIPMAPQAHHIAQHPVTKETVPYRYVVHIFFGTDAHYAGLLQSLGDTPATIEAKLDACAFEVEA
jgi:hypothetical protein